MQNRFVVLDISVGRVHPAERATQSYFLWYWGRTYSFVDHEWNCDHTAKVDPTTHDTHSSKQHHTKHYWKIFFPIKKDKKHCLSTATSLFLDIHDSLYDLGWLFIFNLVCGDLPRTPHSHNVTINDHLAKFIFDCPYRVKNVSSQPILP